MARIPKRALLKRGNGKRKTEDYSAEICRGNASWEFLKKVEELPDFGLFG